jgi:hypothetical protein
MITHSEFNCSNSTPRMRILTWTGWAQEVVHKALPKSPAGSSARGNGDVRPEQDRFLGGPHALEVRAEQRVVQEGSSPSGAQMRGAISKSGGNSSLAEESRRYADV